MRIVRHKEPRFSLTEPGEVDFFRSSEESVEIPYDKSVPERCMRAVQNERKENRPVACLVLGKRAYFSMLATIVANMNMRTTHKWEDPDRLTFLEDNHRDPVMFYETPVLYMEALLEDFVGVARCL